MSYPAKNRKSESVLGANRSLLIASLATEKKSYSSSVSHGLMCLPPKQMATHQWINFWSFWGQLIHWHQVSITECWRSSYIEIVLKKKHSKILNYINSLLDSTIEVFSVLEWSEPSFNPLNAPSQWTWKVATLGRYMDLQSERFNGSTELHGCTGRDTTPSENQPKNMRKKYLWIIPVGSIAWILTGDICSQLLGAGKYRWINCHFLQG